MTSSDGIQEDADRQHLRAGTLGIALLYRGRCAGKSLVMFFNLALSDGWKLTGHLHWFTDEGLGDMRKPVGAPRLFKTVSPTASRILVTQGTTAEALSHHLRRPERLRDEEFWFCSKEEDLHGGRSRPVPVSQPVGFPSQLAIKRLWSLLNWWRHRPVVSKHGYGHKGGKGWRHFKGDLTCQGYSSGPRIWPA